MSSTWQVVSRSLLSWAIPDVPYAGALPLGSAISLSVPVYDQRQDAIGHQEGGCGEASTRRTAQTPAIGRA